MAHLRSAIRIHTVMTATATATASHHLIPIHDHNFDLTSLPFPLFGNAELRMSLTWRWNSCHSQWALQSAYVSAIFPTWSERFTQIQKRWSLGKLQILNKETRPSWDHAELVCVVVVRSASCVCIPTQKKKGKDGEGEAEEIYNHHKSCDWTILNFKEVTYIVS